MQLGNPLGKQPRRVNRKFLAMRLQGVARCMPARLDALIVTARLCRLRKAQQWATLH
jgi:hypothetical protein